jgi:hypothetical protein
MSKSEFGGTRKQVVVSGAVTISGQSVTVSGDHVFVESGVHVIPESGQHVLISGQHVYVESGVHVVAEAEVTSGLHVMISGQHVFVESGVHVVSETEVESGLHVMISGQHVFVESGVHVIPESGQHVLISGQHVYVESGVHVVAEIGVQVQSGIGVLVSGQHIFVESGVFTASGVGVTIQSGAGVTIQSGASVQIQSGADLVVGIYEPVGVTRSSGAPSQLLVDSVGRPTVRIDTHSVMTPVDIQSKVSGVCLISGEHVYVESGVHITVESGIGVQIQSGAGVLISGQHIFVESGVYIASGVGVVAGLPFTALYSGEVHVMSGAVYIYLLSSEVKINTSGNPMRVGAISGGVMLWSAACVSVTVKALSVNSGDVYLGGHAAGQRPYSGQGFLLEPGEAINLDVDNTGKVRLFAEVSGDRCTYAAVTG